MRLDERAIRRIIRSETRRALLEGMSINKNTVRDLRYFNVRFGDMRPEQIRDMLREYGAKVYENPNDEESKLIVIALLGTLGIDESLIEDIGGPSALGN